MPERSLTYFLFFIVIWLGYGFYKVKEENNQLLNLANDQLETLLLSEEVLDKHREALEAQKLYIKLLEFNAQKNSSLYESDWIYPLPRPRPL